jgi:chlorobactene glucosyltransferase
MLIYQVVITTILVALLLNTIINLRLLRIPEPLPPVDDADEQTPLVSLLVPARNEARSIAACVESLARQDYPRCEILVLDDQSEDQTAAIVLELAARYPNIRLLDGRALPANWHGKAWACAQLAQEARGDWLLFVDADTMLAPCCVTVTLRLARARRADVLTMIPTVLAGGLGEALLLPIVPLTFAAFLPLGLVTNHPSPLFAGALGQFLLFRRAAYQRIGGHAAVRTDIVEDMQLSRLVKRHGGRVVWLDGATLLRVRMYHGFAEAWRGIAKSAFAAINYSLLALAPGVAAVLAFFIGPYVALAIGLIQLIQLIQRPSSPPPLWALIWLPLLQVTLLWSAHLLLMRRFHLPLALVVLQPVTMVAVILTTLHAAVQTEFGAGISWKGRTYQFGALRHSGASGARWGAMLAILRFALAVLLLVLAGITLSQVAETLLLLGWTTALLEYLARKGARSRWTIWADMALGLASLGYLQLSGQLQAWLTLLIVLVVALAIRRFSWQPVAALASALLGSLLLLTTEAQSPNTLLMGWFLLIALAVAARSLTQVVIPWLQRLHSS